MTFDSTHQALRSEKLLKGAGIAADLIPIPRHLSAACGLALRLCSTEESLWLTLLAEGAVVYGAIVNYERE